MREHGRTEVSSKKNNLPGKLSKWVIVTSGSCAVANPMYPRNTSPAHSNAAVLRQNAMVDEYVSAVRYSVYERYKRKRRLRSTLPRPTFALFATTALVHHQPSSRRRSFLRRFGRCRCSSFVLDLSTSHRARSHLIREPSTRCLLYPFNKLQ
jgi:hypothetical protein